MKGSVWLGMAVLWAAYATMFTGYVWLRGYDISLLQIVGPVNYYKGKWPPPKFSGTGVFPSGSSAQAAPATGSGDAPSNPWNNPLNPFQYGIL